MSKSKIFCLIVNKKVIVLKSILQSQFRLWPKYFIDMSVIKPLLITKRRRHSCLNSLRHHWLCFKYVCHRFIRIGPTGRISYSQRLTVTARYRIFTGNMFNLRRFHLLYIATNFGARRFPWNFKICLHILTCVLVYWSTWILVYLSTCQPVHFSTCLFV